MFHYEHEQVYRVYCSKKNFENHMELLLIENEGNCDYLSIKDFNEKRKVQQINKTD